MMKNIVFAAGILAVAAGSAFAQSSTVNGAAGGAVTGAIVAVAGLANVSPFRVVKRNAIPLVITTVVYLIATFVIFY